jgi:beta-lactamase regulating signal transducer with metallopeptidase domain
MQGKKIMQHEMVHIRQKHGYEILFSQLIVSIFWMNPFFRIMQQELRLVHEFIADEGSIPIGDTDSFARLLLRSHNEGRYLHTVNGFFQSSVSRRLLMISKTGSGRFLNFRKLSVLPLLLLSVLLFSASLPVTQVDGSQKQRDEKIAAERALMQSGKHPTALKNQ